MEENNVVNLAEEELTNVDGGEVIRKFIVYKIVRGDTLSHIARVYHTTVDELVRINHIKDKNRIYAGDTLLIPVN